LQRLRLGESDRGGGGGRGSVAPQGFLVVKHGVPVALSANPEEGYHFQEWVLDTGQATLANAKLASTTVALTSNAAVRAAFQINSYSLEVQSQTGSCSPSAPVPPIPVADTVAE
jgi:hypothetical protein